MLVYCMKWTCTDWGVSAYVQHAYIDLKSADTINFATATINRSNNWWIKALSNTGYHISCLRGAL